MTSIHAHCYGAEHRGVCLDWALTAHPYVRSLELVRLQALFYGGPRGETTTGNANVRGGKKVGKRSNSEHTIDADCWAPHLLALLNAWPGDRACKLTLRLGPSA